MWRADKFPRAVTSDHRPRICAPEGAERACGSAEIDLARRLLVDAYAPASVLIDSHCECVGFFGPADLYFRIGEVESSSLFVLVRDSVREPLKSALHLIWPCAEARDGEVVPREQTNRFASLRITVRPVRAEGDALLLVSFLDPEAYCDRNGMPLGRSVNLSPRQHTVLDLVAGGHSNKQIAAELGISQRTVETHRVIVMRKLGAKNLADLMRLLAAA